MLALAVTNLLVLVLAAGGGLVVCLVGLRGWREGDTPFCKRCAYNLTGLVSERCPECGAPTDPDGIVYGVRRRRWLLIVGGTVPLVVCLWFLSVITYQHARRINLHRYYPFGWVLTDARNGKAPAFYELIRREKADELPDAKLVQLVETALTVQVQVPPPTN